MRISDWSSDVFSSDLGAHLADDHPDAAQDRLWSAGSGAAAHAGRRRDALHQLGCEALLNGPARHRLHRLAIPAAPACGPDREIYRSEEHTSELKSLMRISYAVFCL